MTTESKPLYEYKCWHEDRNFDEWIPKTYLAETPAKAKYQHADYLHNELEYGNDLFEMLRDMKVKKIGKASINYYFKDNDTWENTKKLRALDFAYLGMEVDVCGKRGVIVGGNSSLNLQVLFDFETRPYTANCHPWYETVYYDRSGNIVADYREGKVVSCQ